MKIFSADNKDAIIIASSEHFNWAAINKHFANRGSNGKRAFCGYKLYDISYATYDMLQKCFIQSYFMS